MEELPKAFDPKLVEEKLSFFWEEKKYFVANPQSNKPSYSIVIPPPNVTGVLHMGHALVNTIQDVLIRWKRMSGYEVLWVPGTDHAGIATQTVVERHLIKTTGKRRKDFSREEFLSHVWDWKDKSEQTILNQIKKLGCSCDWSRLAFTMDQPRNEAVGSMFKKMYDDGLIYQGDYLVNWDPITQTALADDEVEYEDSDSYLWFINYTLEDLSGHLAVATTRPETLLGDTAIAVSPQDERYKHLIGSKVIVPLIGRSIPIIGDPFVDPSFGTGAVKITPAHDPNDYEMGLRHNLDMINIMTPDGKINENGLTFTGLSMEKAREAITKALEVDGLLIKKIPHKNRVGISYRSKAVIQPFLSKQWFVKLSKFKQILIDAVKTKRVDLIPTHFEQTYFHWIDNLRDWCISRQLWWGHRIPIWYGEDRIICYAGEGLPPEVAANPSLWKQDEDVLDTWFSSALWPFSVLGWPANSKDLKKFYPTSTLVTGHDILFFWVARMIMMSEYNFESPPFKQVFLHGLIYGKSYWRQNLDGSISYLSSEEKKVYDMGQPTPLDVYSKWEKMSKSKGNVLDPLEMIADFGTDALRMALCASATQARQIDLDRRRFEEFKNFANKIWNGARFVFMNLEGLVLDKGIDRDLLSLEDKWILSLLNRIIKDVNTHLGEFAFDKAAAAAYDFFWKEFCAYYVEITKPVLFGKAGTSEEKINKQKILLIVLSNAIRLLHPMAPFITEELFGQLKMRFEGNLVGDPYLDETLNALNFTACAIAPYPKVITEADINPDIEARFANIDTLLHSIRNIRAEMQLHPSQATDLYIIGSKPDLDPIEKNQNILKALVRLQNIYYQNDMSHFKLSSNAIVGSIKLVIPLPDEMKEKEKKRLLKEEEKHIQQQAGAQNQLDNRDFITKAPAHLVEKLTLTLQQIERELVEIRLKLSQLQ